jgi:hypothetical protein
MISLQSALEFGPKVRNLLPVLLPRREAFCRFCIFDSVKSGVRKALNALRRNYLGVFLYNILSEILCHGCDFGFASPFYSLHKNQEGARIPIVAPSTLRVPEPFCKHVWSRRLEREKTGKLVLSDGAAP